MSYIGYKPADKPLTSADITDSIITSAKIVDGTIANADVSSSAAIALSKLSTTGTASSSNYLRGDGAWTAVSSDYVLLATSTASSSASISFDGYFSSTYKNYQIIFSDVYPATNNTVLYSRFRRSNADVTGSSYSFTGPSAYVLNDNSSSGPSDNSQAGVNYIGVNSGNLSNSSNMQYNGTVNIFDPLSTSRYKSVNYTMSNYTGDGNRIYTSFTYGTLRDSLAALSGITFYYSSGNISTGTFKLYGIK